MLNVYAQHIFMRVDFNFMNDAQPYSTHLKKKS